MANPASLTINALSANGSVNQPAAQTIDTNGTVNCAAQSQTERLFLECVNAAAAAIDVTVKAGAYPPAHRAGIGDLKVTLAATGSAGDKKLIGPIESSRFAKADGSVDVQFQAASGSPNLTLRVYRLPKAV
jgi:hypothetical protein